MNPAESWGLIAPPVASQGTLRGFFGGMSGTDFHRMNCDGMVLNNVGLLNKHHGQDR
jgi:hypothetical protein